jgi:hypothetical protein
MPVYARDAMVIESAKNVAASRNVSMIFFIVASCILNADAKREVPRGLLFTGFSV